MSTYEVVCDQLVWDKAIFLQKLTHEFQRRRSNERDASAYPHREGARLAARDWLAAMAAHEAHRLEVNSLWLEYLELADPVGAPKIRRLLNMARRTRA